MTQPPQEPEASAPIPRPRVLIAEDNHLVGKQLRTCLEKGLDVRVDVATEAVHGLLELVEGQAERLPFADATFDVIVFSCNGICMMDRAGRVARCAYSA